jgi:type III restriction enzyme
MELKPYQQQVINDVTLFLELIQDSKNTNIAFNDFWVNHPRSPLHPFPGNAIEPYKNNVPKVPHICIKVPTAGGKTFIACNALKTIFDAFPVDKPKAVVWLVPSITILDQTINNLRDSSHPYRQKINSHFGNKVEVFDKATLLQGSGFNADTVKDQLNIMVFSFDSLRAKNKEDRKVFQENGNLQSFESILGSDQELTLGAVIHHLNPVVIVDESHNAESELSVDMLKQVNPCFILDLTATPRKNSNILSFIDAMELKKENMVKLPVIVYNHQDKTEVIHSSLELRKNLEDLAIQEEKKTGKYIRPIVLFQAQPKNGKDFINADEEMSNVQKLKQKLIELQIPANQIKIKTANINEIKGIDLMSKNCEVRYIITINALKEGWDCPFAYILSSLADKSSAVDVEQILGRVLRQPYVTQHSSPLLNMSYVLTASAKFLDTLENIVQGLNRAGFSDKDYKIASTTTIDDEQKQGSVVQLAAFTAEQVGQPHQLNSSPENSIEDITTDIDVSRILTAAPEGSNTTVSVIARAAIEQNSLFEKTISELEASNSIVLPTEINNLVKKFTIKSSFLQQASEIKLPQFYLKIPRNDLFGQGEEDVLLEKESLLDGFQLSKQDTNINFDNVTSELYKIDLDATKNDHTPTFVKIEGQDKDTVMSFILDPSKKGSRVRNLTSRILGIIGNMYPIPDKEIERYIMRILEDFSEEQFTALGSNEYTYIEKIKTKIEALGNTYAESKFKEFIETDRVFMKKTYSLPQIITLSETSKSIAKSLYEKEGSLNGFEERVINEIANMDNVAFWTRNIERRGFKINGFINHYPDFIIQTKSGKIIVLETKGDHLYAEEKIRLGEAWAKAAGNTFRFFMVYDRRIVDGAKNLEGFLGLMRQIG